ncbi:MAG: formyltransferase family protein [Candidatus Sulfotelmatobacter sp.]|jgi:folate-dependent phosphoribosylglycinamide formyltransferase PurN
MRIVILGSSAYSETACAIAVRMAELGSVPGGALVLPSTDRATLRRKLAQWGARGVVNYARTKLIPRRLDEQPRVSNPYLEPPLKHRDGIFRSLREVAALYNFPVATCRDQNSPQSIAQLRTWSPDLIIFTGGDILRKQLLQLPRLGVLNVHLGLLPEIRGMSSPEWSLLNHVPLGITIHYMNEGIDTGPILQRYDFSELAECVSLSDLRNRLIAFGVDKIAEVVTGLDQGAISATPQRDLDKDSQFFVMHEWLQARAAECLANRGKPPSRER